MSLPQNHLRGPLPRFEDWGALRIRPRLRRRLEDGGASSVISLKREGRC